MYILYTVLNIINYLKFHTFIMINEIQTTEIKILSKHDFGKTTFLKIFFF